MMTAGDLLVRTTREDDWRAVRALRLEMLQDTPIAYAETLAHALGIDEAGWRARAARGTTPRQTAVVAIVGGSWVGTMGGYIPDAASGPVLVGVYVAAGHRGERAGVARALLAAVEDWARSFGSTLRLEVHESNTRAIRFYEKLGFTPTGRSRAYELEPGGLELEMIKPLG